MLVMMAMAGVHLGAQEFTGTAVPPGNLDFGASTFGLVPMQSGASDQFALAREAARAGWLNTTFGIWSWANGDILGGALTTVLQVGGIAIIVVPYFQIGEDLGISLTDALMWPLIGTGVIIVGTIFGYVRGSSQFKKQYAAATTATAWTGNPMDHVSFDIVPNGGMLSFKVGF